MINKIKYNKGGASKGLLILAGIIAVAIIIVFVIIRIAGKPPEPENGGEENGNGEEPYQPVYEATIGDIKFTFLDTEDKGDILRGSESIYPQWQKDITTKERFIKVTIGAQNTGKENIPERRWGLGDVIDSENRIFEPLESGVRAWVVSEDYEEDQCGALLKPGFDPLPCIRIYEVAKISTDFKIKVYFSTKSGISEDREEAIIDLFLSP